MHIELQGCLYVPDFQQNYIDASQLRTKCDLILNGDKHGVTYTSENGQSFQITTSNGQEWISAHTHNPASIIINSTHFNNSLITHTQDKLSSSQRKTIRNHILPLDKEQLQKLIQSHPPPNETATRIARLQLAKMGRYTYETGSNNKLLALHHKLGHASMRITAEYARQNNIKLGPIADAFCWHCLKTKITRTPAAKANPHTTHTPFSHFYIDISGPHAKSDFKNENRYALIINEAYSGKLYSQYMTKMDNMDTAINAFIEEVRHDMRTSGMINPTFYYANTNIQADNAKYFSSTKFRNTLERNGISLSFSAPYHSHQNGRAERAIRTINTRYRSLLKAANTKESYWELAHKYVILTYNATPNLNNTHNQSPHLRLTNEEPHLDHLHAFGTKCIAWLPPKTAIRTAHCGKDAGFAATYLGWDNKNRCHIVSSESFDNMHQWRSCYTIKVPTTVPKFMADHTISNLDDSNDLPTEYEHTETTTALTKPTTPLSLPDGWTEHVDKGRTFYHEKATKTSQWRHPAHTRTTIKHIYTTLDRQTPHRTKPANTFAHRHFKSTHTQHNTNESFNHMHSYEVHVAQAKQTICYSLKSALATRYGQKYHAPLNTELGGMFTTGALRPIPITDVGPEEMINRSIMMYYPKHKSKDGVYVLDKLKCRLVFYGKDQIQGIHYAHKASSSPRMATVRTYFATAKPNEDIQQADVSQAYLKAHQHTPTGVRVLMRLPRDIAKFNNGIEEVYVVERAVYGQVHAGLLWQNTFSEWADAAGFARSTVDPCIYYLHSKNKDQPGTATMLLYTDDIAIKGEPHIANIARTLITEKWNCGFEPCEYYLNMKIARNTEGNIILSQEHYINDLTELYRIHSDAPTPLPPGLTIFKMDRATSIHNTKQTKPKKQAPTTDEPTQRHLTFTDDMEPSCNIEKELERTLQINELKQYQSLIGALMYITNTTRPDIAAALATLGTVFAAPKLKHWRYAIHILRYLKGTNNLALRYKHAPTQAQQSHNAQHTTTHPWQSYQTNILDAYVDASYADGPNATSRTGWVIRINDAPVAWRSKTQTIQAQSTMEAEVIAACDITNEIRFLRDLLHEFNMTQTEPTTVHEDNQACIKYTETLSVTDRNKHMAMPLPNTHMAHTPNNFPHTDINMESRQIRVNYHTVRRAVTDKIAKFIYITTDNQLADIMTKNLPVRTHNKFTQGLLTHIDMTQDHIKSKTQNNKRIADTQLSITAITKRHKNNQNNQNKFKILT